MRKLITFEAQYAADGTAVRNKNISFLRDPNFQSAWRRVKEYTAPYRPKTFPDLRWRAHVCVWAARHALHVPGDFVECGVNTGMMMSMICALTSLPQSNKHAYLFDTYAGIPVSSLPEEERATAAAWNENLYTYDSYAIAAEAFKDFPNVHLVKGVLPQVLDSVEFRAIAFLHMDLNVASAEIASAEKLWPKLSPGAIVILDDYGFSAHRPQYEAWNTFAGERELSIATLPTGQGLILIPPR